MTPLRQRMLEDMQLRGLAPRTQESYLAAVQQLALHYHCSPDQITEEELRQYFLYLRNEKRLAPNYRQCRPQCHQVLVPPHPPAPLAAPRPGPPAPTTEAAGRAERLRRSGACLTRSVARPIASA